MDRAGSRNVAALLSVAGSQVISAVWEGTDGYDGEISLRRLGHEHFIVVRFGEASDTVVLLGEGPEDLALEAWVKELGEPSELPRIEGESNVVEFCRYMISGAQDKGVGLRPRASWVGSFLRAVGL